VKTLGRGRCSREVRAAHDICAPQEWGAGRAESGYGVHAEIPPAMNLTEPLPSLKRHQPFALFWTMRVTTTTAYMMQSVAVGWQLYDLTGNALDLGLVGLVQFVPLFLLAVVVGQIIDRYDRRAIARTCQITKAVCALLLAFGTMRGWLGRDAMFAIL